LKIGKLAVVMRKINDDPKNIEDLMFADIAESIKKNVL
jgi:2',3'-cyclic-nucleotide 2'-phosphodiesterase (5'-nucleotidase family)